MGGFKDAYQDVQPVTLRLAEENVISSLYCSSAEGIEAHVSTLVEAFLVEVYRCRVCQFTSSQKAKISHHVLERHDPVSPCPHLPCLEKEDEESLGVGMRVHDEEEVDHNSSPYDLESDLHSGSKSSDDQMDMERMSFLLPMYGMFQNISPRSCDIGLGSNSDGNLHVAQTCEVSTLFEEDRHDEDSEEEPVFQLEDANTDLAVPLNSGMDTEIQDEEMAQSAHLMTLGLCRISSTKCQPQSATSAKSLSHPEGEQDAGHANMDAEMQKPSEEDGGLACILCQIVVSSRSMLEVHLKCHSGDQGFRCPRCGWESEDWVDMEQHWRGHGKRKSSKRHKCSICPRTFRRVDSRDAHEERHNQRHHCRSVSGGLVQCSLCLEWCLSGKEWVIHQECHFQGGFKCLHCDFKEKSWNKTLKHIHTQHKQLDTSQKKQVAHSRENQQLNTSTRYPECLRRMKPESWSQVRKNRVKNRVVAREKSNERGKDRVGHLKSDTSVGLTVSRRKEFCCNLCDKKFSTKMTMRRHMVIHQGDKPFKCPHCHYCARLKASLIQHLRVHTGEKPYKCLQCYYASIDRSSLRRHLRTHTQEKPYRCQYCPYSSIQKKSLDLHSWRHHTGESFPCQLCQYSTPDRQLLVRHKRKHHSAEQTAALEQRNCSGSQTAPTQRAQTSK
ncbi:zinc finger protein 667-like [Sinocyclocheilus rhinocerous]|uniref:Zinc finger protein 667-like n=1 Tax=Sinocyclocheilus rhinocerous TaxID=307959 RepID=A0A673KUV1_9TELE|nr:PREDICTED: zinc finger protein 667-like [Sinocyclocheilus rhinocerous]